jgi:putative NADH-flavin reductase
MPVIIVGADTEIGTAIVAALLPRQGEVRGFVTDLGVAEDLKRSGVKVALGDVSDGSHIGGAALSAFGAILVAAAADDERERSFAPDRDAVIAAWVEALTDAAVQRAIWVGDGGVPEPIANAVPESAAVSTTNRSPEEIAAAVAALDEAPTLP